MRRVTGVKRFFSSPNVSSSLVLTSPSTVIFQASGSLVGSGISPLLRMKNLDVGVVSSSSRCSGVSATSGRSPKTTRPESLPGNCSGCGPLGAGGAAVGASFLSCARAAGIQPAGILSPYTIVPPTAAPMAASPAPPRNPRRVAPVLRPNTTASARSGSS